MALVKLGKALSLLERRLPHHTHPVLEVCINRLAEALPFPQGAVLKRLLRAPLADVILDHFPDKRQARHFNAMLRNTAVPTVVRGGETHNVIPAEAEATVDGRLALGQSAESFRAELRELVGDYVDVEITRSQPPTISDPDTPLFRTVTNVVAQHDLGGTVVPTVMTGATDAKYFSRLGTKYYGFAPVRLEPGMDFGALFHGHDERVPIEGFRFGLQALYDVVRDFCL
jgi:acetylornithine deacetylase/succinyl-diaminopimelate desuccinylase-like protein